MAISLGGSNFKWQGRNLRILPSSGFNCVAFPRQDSMIMVPVQVSPNTKYKVSIKGSVTNGNGKLLINFFGGLNYDGPHVGIGFGSTNFSTYDIKVATPVFPKSIPMMLRVWRASKSSGDVRIREIAFEEITETVATKITRLASATEAAQAEGAVVSVSWETPAGVSLKNKFKPRKRLSKMSQEVRVINPEDVPKVSIITPTREGKDLIVACYKALIENTTYPNWEWIIGDSSSQDGTQEYFEKIQDPRIKFIQRGTTEGSFSSINNELATQASGDYYVFLNDDTQPQFLWLDEMVAKIIHNPEVGIVGARLSYPNGKLQHAGIMFVPEGPINVGKPVLSAFNPDFTNQDRYYQAVTGACLLISAKDFHALDGFETVYHFCYEDVSLCLRLVYELNKKVLYAANARVIHNESITQKKFSTAGTLQQAGIKYFKDKWMKKVHIDFTSYQKNPQKGLREVDFSVVTCVSNLSQYLSMVVGSLFKNETNKNYELIPILNTGNKYSAAQALNLGVKAARSNLILTCHQDVLFYQGWVERFFGILDEINAKNPNWGVIGTAGINEKDDTIGVVHDIRGKINWQSTRKRRFLEVQTLDEHCMILRKNSGLRFDEEVFPGFHFYGIDFCLQAIDKKMPVFGILCPLVHDSNSGSLRSGKEDFMKYLKALAKKWGKKFGTIRTPTSIVYKGSPKTFIKFKE